MLARSSLFTILAAATVAAAAAFPAQASWNRRIHDVAVVPTSVAGKFDVHVVWSVELTPNSIPLNLDTDALIFIGNSEVPLALDSTKLSVNPGGGFCGTGSCAGSCGTGYIDGIIAAAFLCIDSDWDGDCECSMPPITSSFPGMELPPGAEITAVLFPSAGSLGEPNDADDSQSFVFTGPRFWTRGLEGASLVPNGGTAGGFKLQVEGFAGWKGKEGTMNLDMEVELRSPSGALIEVVAIAGHAMASDPLACGGIGCGGYCGNWNGFDVDCFASNPIVACMCGGGWLHLWFPDESFEPGDQITLVLKSAPAALPTLPGLGEPTTMTLVLQSVCTGDLNGDGIVNGADLGKLLSNWGGTGLGDLNGDGTVNGADLGLVLSNWGPCAPV